MVYLRTSHSESKRTFRTLERRPLAFKNDYDFLVVDHKKIKIRVGYTCGSHSARKPAIIIYRKKRLDKTQQE